MLTPLSWLNHGGQDKTRDVDGWEGGIKGRYFVFVGLVDWGRQVEPSAPKIDWGWSFLSCFVVWVAVVDAD
jgi:hypothetical protein